ncbi:hypothetical protein [Pseudoduganella rhizocola]|uniref:hypothetical protein n=1 Tax=Pseudoduganella rhizocola TaxID=3382643 RepID=UPI0038B42584
MTDLLALAEPVATAAIAPALLLVVRFLFFYIEKTFPHIWENDVYLLSAANGRRVEIVLRKAASAEERARIFNEKVRELGEQRPA